MAMGSWLRWREALPRERPRIPRRGSAAEATRPGSGSGLPEMGGGCGPRRAQAPTIHASVFSRGLAGSSFASTAMMISAACRAWSNGPRWRGSTILSWSTASAAAQETSPFFSLPRGFPSREMTMAMGSLMRMTIARHFRTRTNWMSMETALEMPALIRTSLSRTWMEMEFRMRKTIAWLCQTGSRRISMAMGLGMPAIATMEPARNAGRAS